LYVSDTLNIKQSAFIAFIAVYHEAVLLVSFTSGGTDHVLLMPPPLIGSGGIRQWGCLRPSVRVCICLWVLLTLISPQ